MVQVVSDKYTGHHMDGTYIPGKTGSFTYVFLFEKWFRNNQIGSGPVWQIALEHAAAS